MTSTGLDSRGRRNPCVWKVWARSENAPDGVAVALVTALNFDGRTNPGGGGAKARRTLRRLNVGDNE